MKEFGVLVILLFSLWHIRPASGETGRSQASRMDLVAVVGCIVQDGTSWFVANATGPLTEPSPDGSRRTGQFVTIETARQQDPGTRLYRLIGVIEEYEVPEHHGHRVLARGLLVEDDDETRLNVTAVLMLEPKCP